MNVSEELIREIVQKVLEESAAKQAPAEDFVKEKDPSGIIKIATETVKCERFEQDGVALKDVVTLEELRRPMRMSASTDTDVCTDRCEW